MITLLETKVYRPNALNCFLFGWVLSKERDRFFVGPSYFSCTFLIGKQTNILEWGKPKWEPQTSTLEVYKGAKNGTKGGLRQKTTNPPHKLHRTQQASNKGKVHIRNHSCPRTKRPYKKGLKPIKRKLHVLKHNFVPLNPDCPQQAQGICPPQICFFFLERKPNPTHYQLINQVGTNPSAF